MPLGRARGPFSNPEWVFEVKHEGFRALLYSDNAGMRLVSRNGNIFKSFPGLCDGLQRDLKGRRCVLDGEIVCLDRNGRSQFKELLFHRGEPYFYAFDLLWDEHAWSDDESERRRFRNGEDTRYLPLTDRKYVFAQLFLARPSACSTASTSRLPVKNCRSWRRAAEMPKWAHLQSGGAELTLLKNEEFFC